MKSIHKLSIRVKFALILSLLTASTLFLSGAVLYFYDLQLFRQELSRNMMALASVVTDNCSAALSFNSSADAERSLASLRNEPHVVTAILYQKDDQGNLKPFASYLRTGEV